jgi:hypothetical protein
VPQQALFLMNSPMAIDVARSILKSPTVARRNARDTVFAVYRTVLGRAPRAEEAAAAYRFIGHEGLEEHRVLIAAKEMTEKANKKAEERAKRAGQMADNALSAIQNTGEMIERKPLSAWETFAHALLLTNEAAYIN